MSHNKMIEKILKASQNQYADVLADSKILNQKDVIVTEYPALNIAMSGELDQGMNPGFLMIGGKSRHFKTMYMLLLAKAYLDKYKDATMILFDSEFGAALDYFASVGIDPNRVAHLPIQTVEDLKFQLSNVLESIERGDKVIMCIDSLGNLASNKEIEDAKDGKQVADMTRAKAMKSLSRIFTTQLVLKDIPLIGINHVYETLEMFSKTITSGGTGLVYTANDIWIIGRSQEKDGKDLKGYTFTITIDKSRKVKEKSKIPVTVLFEGGIEKYSGLLDIALEGNFIVKPKLGWYKLATAGEDVKAVRESDTDALLEQLVKDQAFKDYVKSVYKLGGTSVTAAEEIEEGADGEEE